MPHGKIAATPVISSSKIAKILRDGYKGSRSERGPKNRPRGVGVGSPGTYIYHLQKKNTAKKNRRPFEHSKKIGPLEELEP